ncbi:hypothetical protein J2I47_20540 [Fibrella sp. HMF5335]|uniref:Thioredoxin-related protein n=1 Tax=Fibrella rubiginis TaxID=2817060 RepID=A0A939GJI7_9BACT|nr:hypothetical protein [Fibrella rubiginis]MBO0938953.1 hypothetical protein [Fibrella rubiginis]
MKCCLSFSLILALLLTTTVSLAQGIVFETGTWADAVKKARKQKKLLFLHFDTRACDGCADVASMAFNSPLTREKFGQNFISYRIDGTTGIGKELVDLYEVECLPSSIYLDTDENPLARFCGSTSFDRAYLEKAEEALTNQRERPMKSIIDAYGKGDRSSALMRQYIVRRRQMGLTTNDLLNEYVRALPADSLQSAALLRFIFEQGPVVGSTADSVFQSNRFRYDSLYRAVGLQNAINNNNLIVNNSLKKAIKEKNTRLALRTASFRRATYGSDIKNGRQNADWVYLRYLRGVKDTLAYLQRASSYYDEYLMNAKVDSIQNLDNLDNQRRMRGVMPPPTSQNSIPGGGVAFTPFPNTQRFVSALNTGAWDFYQMTRDTTYLKKALTWSKRSLEFREEPSLMDTYAHLLYRLGRKEEALDWQEKAVKAEQARTGSPLAASLETSLRKMKEGTL